ncbi:TPA: hypothetical protein SL867_005058 [Pseudomonas aeruginosa]|nr:hypothetical protein [Pseudomonas aeruginosa]
MNKALVEQAGGDERAEFERAFTVQEGVYFDDKRGEYRSMNLRAIEATDAQDLNLRLQGWQARAALAQPSPVPELERSATFSVPSCENSYGFGYVDGTCIQSLRGYRDHLETIVDALPEGELMTVAQHERIVKAWIERWKAYIELSAKIAAQRDAADARLHEVATACATAEQERDAALAEVERLRESKGDPSGSFDRCMKMMYERDENAKRLDAALARVAELEGKLTDWVHEGFRLNEALAVAKAQHNVPDDDMILQIFADNAEHSEQGDEHGYCIVREQHAQAIARKLLAAAPGKEVGHE